MSERSQGKSSRMREKMLSHYGTDLHHKHNKNHLSYPPNLKLHPEEEATETVQKWSHKTILSFKARKTRKRLDKGHFH